MYHEATRQRNRATSLASHCLLRLSTLSLLLLAHCSNIAAPGRVSWTNCNILAKSKGKAPNAKVIYLALSACTVRCRARLWTPQALPKYMRRRRRTEQVPLKRSCWTTQLGCQISRGHTLLSQTHFCLRTSIKHFSPESIGTNINETPA